MVDIIIFAVITALLFWKLKSILGKEDENFTPKKMNFQVKDVTTPKQEKDLGFVASLIDLKKENKEANQIDTEGEIKKNLQLLPAFLEKDYTELCKIVPSGVFSVKTFKEGIEAIFVELINSQNTKDTIGIEAFVSPEFLKFFKEFLEKQNLENPKQMINLVKIESIDFISISAKESDGVIKVKILSSQLRYTKEGEAVISGSVSIPSNFTDTLTFTRNAKNNSWFLTKVD